MKRLKREAALAQAVTLEMLLSRIDLAIVNALADIRIAPYLELLIDQNFGRQPILEIAI
jgi:hypothetical protein